MQVCMTEDVLLCDLMHCRHGQQAPNELAWSLSHPLRSDQEPVSSRQPSTMRRRQTLQLTALDS